MWIAIAIGWTIFVSWWAIVLRQETARSLGIAFGVLTVERDVSSLDGGWSNSNLTGSAGFQRTSLSLGVTIRP